MYRGNLSIDVLLSAGKTEFYCNEQHLSRGPTWIEFGVEDSPSAVEWQAVLPAPQPGDSQDEPPSRPFSRQGSWGGTGTKVPRAQGRELVGGQYIPAEAAASCCVGRN